MKQDHRFEADMPVYMFRRGEHACGRFDAAAADDSGCDFRLEVKDVSAFGFIAVSERLPAMGETVEVRLPGLKPCRAAVTFADGHWAAYVFEQELDWTCAAGTLLADRNGAARAAAA